MKLALTPERLNTLLFALDTATRSMGLRAFQPDMMDLIQAVGAAQQPDLMKLIEKAAADGQGDMPPPA
jgi:hypothetical protein